MVSREVESIKNFLFHTTDLDYTDSECEFILENRLLHDWIE